MKILITGGAGFVGALLARTLLQRGTLGGRELRQVVLADQASAPPSCWPTPACKRAWARC